MIDDPLMMQTLPPWLLDEMPLEFSEQTEANTQASNEKGLQSMKPQAGKKRVRAEDHSRAIRKMLARNKNASKAGLEFRDPYRDETLQWMHEQEV